jgi:transaldolase/glucose-6-phosphate isomerase
MSVAAEVNQRLRALTEAGTSVWLDQIRRGLIEGGELQRLVEQDSLRGVTSNPAIFEKAILGSDEYDEHLRELAERGLGPSEIYDELAIRDVQLAADVLRPVWDETEAYDGYVSLEVSPELAHDMDRTLDQARDYWHRVDRPNVMIKIPGTDEGLPAIERAIAEGINVNVTLLFAVEQYVEVTERYIRGLEARRADGLSLDVHSVASFFVSRVDSEVDKRLEAIGREDLNGRAAIANARDAYRRFREIFLGDRFAELRAAGAPVQRPLWASTGVKNPRYPDTMYVDELIAPNTVNTMPMQTLLAVEERGEARGATADQDPSPTLTALAEAGIDMDDVTDTLLRDGIEKFVEPMDKLLAGLESAREAQVTGRPATIESSLPEALEPAITARVKRAAEEQVAQRIWRKDDTLWGPAGAPEVANRLGWLTITEPLREDAESIRRFVEECRADGLTDAVLLGMGGSSLAPEVIRRSFTSAGRVGDGLRLRVLDSTDPAAVLDVDRAIDPSTTLFLVSSKSGGTIEPLSFYAHFRARVREAIGDDAAGGHFAAITDPGTSLLQLARDHGFRRVFENDPDIGGRYSALSHFGLVPAALTGVDIDALLDSAQVAEQACANYDHSSSNQGLWLGLALGELAVQGRDKLTISVSEPLASFGLWAEQLVAESTGKHGKGILPVAGEPLGAPEEYGEDRVFCHLRDPEADDDTSAGKLKALADTGHPTLALTAGGPEDLGRIFFFAEFATAVAGWVLGINPFDQPNVQEAKDNTAAVLEAYARDGRLPDVAEADDDELRAILGLAEPPRYVAVMAYVAPSEDFDAAVDELRTAIRRRTRATTTFGYGPRFLHSTGQFHKGGPPTGVFLQLVHEPDEDVEIPDAGYSFGTLEAAQATGDLQTLRAHELPAARVTLTGDPARALRTLTERVEGLL